MLVMSSTNLFRQQTLQLLRGFTVGTRVKLDPRYYSVSVKLRYLYSCCNSEIFEVSYASLKKNARFCAVACMYRTQCGI